MSASEPSFTAPAGGTKVNAAGAGVPFVPKSLGIKVGMLLAVAGMVAVSLVGYVLYARGVFEATQRLVLLADKAANWGITLGGIGVIECRS